jgi:competence CoiA-like predicted nuclease
LDTENQNASGIDEHILKEAWEVGCFGLVRGVAIRKKTGVRISANVAEKADAPFVCPRCWTPAIVRKDRGGGRREHFAHFAPLTPIVPHEETEIHQAAKNEICEALKEVFPNGDWRVERTIHSYEKNGVKIPELRPDVSGYLGSQRIVIETQWSTLSLATILRRSKGYRQWRTPILWILPLQKPLKGEFRPRSFERYLHSMYFGRVFYWQQGDGLKVTPTHYEMVERWVDTREWIDSEGEKTAGGFYKKLRLIKTASNSKSINIARDFKCQMRPEFYPWNEKRMVPRLLLWRDTLAPWWDEASEEATRQEWDNEEIEDFNGQGSSGES